MTKILVLQFRRNELAIAQEQKCLIGSLGSEVEVVFVSALDSTINWGCPRVVMGDCKGVILGGSGDFDFDGNRPATDEVRKVSVEILTRLRPLFDYLFRHDIPTLGICYGHQLLGAFAGVRVIYSPEQKKTCSHRVEFLIAKDRHVLFANLPQSFYAHYSHKDVLDRVPAGAELLMSGGESCLVTALGYSKNINTFQFHPELTSGDISERMGYISDSAQIATSVFKDDPNSNLILQNFSKLVIEQDSDKTKGF